MTQSGDLHEQEIVYANETEPAGHKIVGGISRQSSYVKGDNIYLPKDTDKQPKSPGITGENFLEVHEFNFNDQNRGHSRQ